MRFGVRHSRSSTLVPGGARARRALVVAALIPAVLVALVGCGSGGGSTTTTHAAQAHRPTTLDVYASLPLSGPQSAQARSVLNGIKLSLSQLPKGKAGAYHLRLRTYNDASVHTRGWSANAAAANARRAATNPNAILYIGELDSGASAASIPILTEASIPQISPGSTATYLTSSKTADQATFLRLVPDDGIAAEPNLLALHKLGCTHAVVVGDAGGQGLINAMRSATSRDGVDLINIDKNSALAPKTAAGMASYVASAQSLAQSLPHECVFYSGVATPQAVALIRALRVSLPASAAVVGSSQLCDASWAQAVAPPSRTGNAADVRTTTSPTATVSAAGQSTTSVTTTTPTTTTTTRTTTTGTPSPPADTGLWCTSPTPDLQGSTPGLAFIKAYKREYHDRAPDLPAVFGYEAMQLGVRAIKSLGVSADSRQQLLEGLHKLCVKESALGPLAFEVNGDSTLTTYSLYKVNAGGSLSFDRWLSPPPPSATACR